MGERGSIKEEALAEEKSKEHRSKDQLSDNPKWWHPEVLIHYGYTDLFPEWEKGVERGITKTQHLVDLP